jgi:hypothetical protein
MRAREPLGAEGAPQLPRSRSLYRDDCMDRGGSEAPRPGRRVSSTTVTFPCHEGRLDTTSAAKLASLHHTPKSRTEALHRGNRIVPDAVAVGACRDRRRARPLPRSCEVV